MGTRHRAFNALFYPESAPEDFRSLIAGWNVPALLVLHDKDKEADGSDKKPHYHLLVIFSGVKTYAQVHELTDQLGSKVLEPSRDLRASARYLAHLDHPEKFQYGIEAIAAFSGASVADLTAPMGDPTPEILTFVRAQGLTEYSALVDYCQDEHLDWLKEVKGHSMFWGFYFSSARNRKGEGGRGGKYGR
jgi:hypothetical protein